MSALGFRLGRYFFVLYFGTPARHPWKPEMPAYAVISSASSIRPAGLFPPPTQGGHSGEARSRFRHRASHSVSAPFRPQGLPLLPPGCDRRLLRRHLTRPPAYLLFPSFDPPGMTSLRSVCLCWAVPIPCLFYRCAQNSASIAPGTPPLSPFCRNFHYS